MKQTCMQKAQLVPIVRETAINKLHVSSIRWNMLTRQKKIWTTRRSGTSLFVRMNASLYYHEQA